MTFGLRCSQLHRVRGWPVASLGCSCAGATPGPSSPIRLTSARVATTVYRVSKPRSYWQQQYEDAEPPRLLLRCADHRGLARALAGGMLLLSLGLVVWAATDGGSLVSPIINVIVFSIQFVLWGFLFPRQVDEWRSRRPVRDH